MYRSYVRVRLMPLLPPPAAAAEGAGSAAYRCAQDTALPGGGTQGVSEIYADTPTPAVCEWIDP
jgi:hypothetical protein